MSSSVRTRCAAGDANGADLRVAADAASDAPSGLSQFRHWRRIEHLYPTLRIAGHGEIDAAAVAALCVVENDSPVPRCAARPLPVGKTPFQRRVAAIHVEIAVALPAKMGLIEGHLDPRARRDRPPPMIACFVQGERLLRYGSGNHANRPPNAAGNRHGDLIEADRQRLAVPGKATGADVKRVSGTADGAARPLRHRPALAVLAIERDIDGAMVERIGRGMASRKGVIGREHAADKGDDGDAVLAVVA